MMAFELLSGQVVYVKRETIGDPYWDNGVMMAGEIIVSYESITDCFIEPVDREETEYLPSGLNIRDSRWLLTDTNLSTVRENNDDASMADVVYLGNPTTGKKKTPYVVWDKEDWETDAGMELLDSDGYNFIIVKQGKV